MNKKEQPTIKTERLIIRPYSLNDASELQRLIDDRDIALPAINIPHPYKDGMAKQWIQKSKEEEIHFAIAHHEQQFFIGGIDLFSIDKQNKVAELGYWIGKPYWGQGYCSEAARAVMNWAFRTYSFNRMYAWADPRNVGSWRVLEKLGMKREGQLRSHLKWNGEFRDQLYFGILRSEWKG